jgi:hypothetical protein
MLKVYHYLFFGILIFFAFAAFALLINMITK